MYVMCVLPPGLARMTVPFRNLMEVIYVGKTIDLRRRYTEHLDTPSAKVRAARITYSDSLRFWFLRTPRARASTIESLLIGCFGPAANDRPGDILQAELGKTSKA